MVINVELVLNPLRHSVSAHIRNLGLEPIENCQVHLDRLDRFVERLGDFTRNSSLSILVNHAASVPGDTTSSGTPFLRAGGGHRSALTLAGSNVQKGPQPPWPVFREAGIWIAEFSIHVGGHQVGSGVRFFRWQPGSDIELVEDPRTQSVFAAPENTRRMSLAAPPENLSATAEKLDAGHGPTVEAVMQSTSETVGPAVKRRGRKADEDLNRTIAAIIQPFGEHWSKRLEDVCEALDRAGVPLVSSGKWIDAGCKDWADVLLEDSNGLTKALAHRLSWTEQNPERG